MGRIGGREVWVALDLLTQHLVLASRAAQESRVLKFSICRPVDIEGSFEAHAARGGVLVQSIKTQFFCAYAPTPRRGTAPAPRGRLSSLKARNAHLWLRVYFETEAADAQKRRTPSHQLHPTEARRRRRRTASRRRRAAAAAF